MPGRNLVSKALQKASVSFSKREFGKKGSKADEYRVRLVFPAAGQPVSKPHGFGRKPESYSVVSTRIDPALGNPGSVYHSFPWATPTHVTLYCTVAGTRVELVLR